MDTEATGPALAELLEAQQEDDSIAGHERIATLAQSVIRLSVALGRPLLWPIGPAAERVAGAATLLGRGVVRARGWNTELIGEHVLVFATTLLTTQPIVSASRQAALLGAKRVSACGVHVEDAAALAAVASLDYFPLELDASSGATAPDVGPTRQSRAAAAKS